MNNITYSIQKELVSSAGNYLGIKSNRLTKAGIIMYKDSKVEISENGELFFDELLKRKTMLGLRSVFYHEGLINYLAMALMRTENYLWFLDTTDNACIMSLTYEELQSLIGTMISPGEEPPEMKTEAEAEPKAEAEPIEEPKVKIKATTPKFCRNCGEKLGSGAKFCKKCGSKIEPGK
ncbi:zinc-ribbon domain-containing protein [Tissierella creatinini]|nr:zinc-ribbon domain-containing protein [Tissierella creatinini]TJX60640.1 zinc-ribbon domain-containing protein [Soehngenia saccharolytica]